MELRGAPTSMPLLHNDEIGAPISYGYFFLFYFDISFNMLVYYLIKLLLILFFFHSLISPYLLIIIIIWTY